MGHLRVILSLIESKYIYRLILTSLTFQIPIVIGHFKANLSRIKCL